MLFTEKSARAFLLFFFIISPWRHLRPLRHRRRTLSSYPTPPVMPSPDMEQPTVIVRFVAGAVPVELRGAHNVTLSVPTSLGRKGLRNLLHHLLSPPEPLPDFHFLLLEQPLRTTLDKFLSRRNLSSEQTLSLTYYLPLPSPRLNPPLPLGPEWLASVHLSDTLTLSAGYSCIPILLHNSTPLLTPEALLPYRHDASIKSAVLFPDHSRFITASQDRSARLWSLNVSEKELHPIAELRTDDIGSPAAFESVAVSSKNSSCHVALGAADGSVWLAPDVSKYEDRSSEQVGEKRKDVSLQTMHATKLGLTSTDLCVSDVAWQGSELWSCGWDAMVRKWDVEKGASTVAIPAGGKAVTGMAVGKRLIVVSSVDGAVRVLDARDGKGVMDACGRRTAHRGIVMDVDWLDEGLSAVSGGVDGTVRLWDLRAMLAPAHVVEDVQGKGGKVLAVSAHKESKGGAVACVGSAGNVARMEM